MRRERVNTGVLKARCVHDNADVLNTRYVVRGVRVLALLPLALLAVLVACAGAPEWRSASPRPPGDASSLPLLSAAIVSEPAPPLQLTTTTAQVRLVPDASSSEELSLYLADRYVELVLSPDHAVDDEFLEIEPYVGPIEFREGGRVIKTLSNLRLDAGSAHTFVFSRDARGRVDVLLLQNQRTDQVSRR